MYSGGRPSLREDGNDKLDKQGSRMLLGRPEVKQ